MATIEDLSVSIGVEDTGLEQQVSRIGDIMEQQFAEKIADGVDQAGKSLENFARSQGPLTEQTRGLARMLDLQEDEVRDLAGSLTDVTRPLDQVLDTMELGRQQGIKNVDQLSEFVVAWDTVGDATGESADQLAKSGVALRAFGIDAENTSDAFPAFGFILEETTLEVSEFQNMLSRVGPELDGMEMSLDDAAAITGILEKDFGLAGKALNREFSTAVRNADGDLDNMLDGLGISKDRFEEMSGVVDESSNIIQRNADEFGASFTPMQKLESMMEQLMFQYGTFAEVAGMLAPVLMALGPLLKVVAAGKMLLNGALLASPITWIVLAIIALIVIIVLLVKNWDTVRDAVIKAWKAIVGALKTAWDWIKGTLWENGLKRFFAWVIDIVKAYFRAWKSAFDSALGVVKNVWSWLKGLPGKIKSAFSKLAGFITAPFRAGFNAVSTLWNNTIGKLSWTVPSWVPGIGGNTISAPQLPTFHDGGMVPGRGDQLILAQGGEGVFTREQMRAMGTARGGDGAQLPDEFVADVVIDLGEGIERAVEIKLRRKDRSTVRRVHAGAGRAR